MIKVGPNQKYKMHLRSGRISKKYNHFFKKPVLLFRKKRMYACPNKVNGNEVEWKKKGVMHCQSTTHVQGSQNKYNTFVISNIISETSYVGENLLSSLECQEK